MVLTLELYYISWEHALTFQTTCMQVDFIQFVFMLFFSVYDTLHNTFIINMGVIMFYCQYHMCSMRFIHISIINHIGLHLSILERYPAICMK